MKKSLLLLFDIDGTLIHRTGKRPSRKQLAFKRAIKEVYGISDVNYMDYPIFGQTDRGILHLILKSFHIPAKRISDNENVFLKKLIDNYDALTHEEDNGYICLPGVKKLLDRLRHHHLGIATGNLEYFASEKLKQADIQHYFTFGGFGNHSLDRAEIVKKAIAAAKVPTSASKYLFGDTPSDIRAGKTAGCRIIATATGHFSEKELSLYSSPDDLVVKDLEEYGTILNFLSKND
ncbi:HAD hydrolase-like protein [bacterium]|nr:HAD hydrolase-like protein [candidate division CSSED10-310 bacterium]